MFCKLAPASLAFTVLCLGSATVARADTTVFTDRAAFTAASTGLTIINFEGIVPPVYFNSAGGLTVSGVNFIATGGAASLSVTTGGASTTSVLVANTTGGGILATLPTNTTAVGVDLRDILTGSPSTGEIALSTGELFTVTLPGNFISTFFGVTSNVPIISIEFRGFFTPGGAATSPAVDDFTFGQAITQQQPPGAIPEPATVLLLGTGLAGVAAKSRYRRRKAQRGGEAA